MPSTKSASKALRQTKKRRSLNLSYKKRVKKALKSGDISLVYKALDKAAKRGLIKKNTANRRKSRGAKKLLALSLGQAKAISDK